MGRGLLEMFHRVSKILGLCQRPDSGELYDSESVGALLGRSLVLTMLLKGVRCVSRQFCTTWTTKTATSDLAGSTSSFFLGPPGPMAIPRLPCSGVRGAQKVPCEFREKLILPTTASPRHKARLCCDEFVRRFLHDIERVHLSVGT